MTNNIEELKDIIVSQEVEIHRFLKQSEQMMRAFQEVGNKYADLKIKYEPATDEAKQYITLKNQAQALQALQAQAEAQTAAQEPTN